MTEEILFFTEGGREIGLGHVSRCAALATGFVRLADKKTTFLLRGDETSLSFLKLHGFEGRFFDWERELDLLLPFLRRAEVAVIDSYTASVDFYRFVAKRVSKLLVFDDFFRLSYPKDAYILNPTAEPNGNPRHLYGLEYVVLRPAFWEVPSREIKERVERVMVTFGGEDLRGLTPLAVEAVREVLPEAECAVVVGPAFNLDENKIYHPRLKLYRNLSAEEMRDLMLASDIAISAGGQTVFELLRLCIPSIIIIVANNQRNNISCLKKHFLVLSLLGSENRFVILKYLVKYLSFLVSPKYRKQMIDDFGIIDGKGCQKVVKSLLLG